MTETAVAEVLDREKDLERKLEETQSRVGSI